MVAKEDDPFFLGQNAYVHGEIALSFMEGNIMVLLRHDIQTW